MSSNVAQPDLLSEESTKKRGFTLTEIAIVLGIIGLILGAVWSAASSVYANLRTSQASQGIIQTAQAVRSMYANSMSFGTTTGDITSPGMFPTGWNSTVSKGIICNPWVPACTGNNAHVAVGNSTIFSIQLDNISDTGCAALISQFNSSAGSGGTATTGGVVTGLYGTKVTSATYAIAGQAVGTPSTTAGTFAAPSSCSNGGQNDTIEIVFNLANM